MNIYDASKEWDRRRRRFHATSGSTPVAVFRRSSWPEYLIGVCNGMYQCDMWRKEQGYPEPVMSTFCPEMADLLAEDWVVIDFPFGSCALYEDPENRKEGP